MRICTFRNSSHSQYMELTIISSILATVLAALLIWTIQSVLWPRIKRTGTLVSDPTYENPYPKDGTRAFPYSVRFLRTLITAKIGKLQGCYGEVHIESIEGEHFDSPGLLHWMRQPRGGIGHPLALHENIKTPEDARDHMYSYHFSENTPVDILHGASDKIDLLMKIQNLDYAITTVSRESRIPPGIYILHFTLHSPSLSAPIHKNWRVEITSMDIRFQSEVF